MARKSFNRVMDQLKDELLQLGSMVETAVMESVNALIQGDTAAAKVTYQKDQFINEKRFAIENAVLIQIATQQPMAHDLRFLAAILEIITELERMGDYAKGIAKVTLLMKGETELVPRRTIQEMASLDISMLRRALTAFINEEPGAAQQIALEDDQIDDANEQIYRQMVDAMIRDATVIDAANHVLWVTHNLERLADLVVNICERTIFISTGELLELSSEEEEEVIP